MLRPREQGSTEEPPETFNKTANAFKDNIVALYKKVLHLLVLLACSSAENGSLLLSQGKSPESIPSVSHFYQERPVKEDMMQLEQALAISINGAEIGAQLRRILVPAERKGDQAGKETVSTDQTEDETRRADEVLNKLHVVHRPTHPLTADSWAFQVSLCRWAIKTPEYLDWASTNGSRVLWVTGDAGSGKTALLKTLAQHLIKQGSQSECTVAYFFCDGTLLSEGGSPAMIVRSLIWHILSNRRSLIKHLETKLSSTKKDNLGHPNDFYAVSTLLYTLIQDHGIGTIYFVIDGMEHLCVGPSDSDSSLDDSAQDPYGDMWGLEDMLRLIATTLRLSARVRWLISTSDVDMKKVVEHYLDFEMSNNIQMEITPECLSDVPHDRHDNDMTTELETLDTENKKALAEMFETEANIANNTGRVRPTQKQMHISTDLPEVRLIMERYITSKVRALARKSRYGGQLQSRIQEKLKNGSSGNLLWVNTPCDAIESQGIPWEAPLLLESLSPGVPELYAQMRTSLHGLGADNREYCEIVLTTAAVAFRPLTVIELEDIVYAPVADMTRLPVEVDLNTLIAGICFPFLEVVENKVSFKHSAARQYLQKDIEKRGKLSEAHGDLIRRCLQTLSSRRRQNAVPKSGPISYATISWIRHLHRLETSHLVAVLKSVNEFLSGNLLTWVEMLLSQRLMGQAQKHLQKTETLLVERVCYAVPHLFP